MGEMIFSESWEALSIVEKKKEIEAKLNGLIPAIVFIDDDPSALEIFKHEIESLGIEALVSLDVDGALNHIVKNKNRILLIVSDFKMPEMDGLEFRKKVLELSSETPFCILSGYVDREMALKGIEYKISAFLEKPIKATELIKVLKNDGEARAQELRDEYELLKGFTDDAVNLVESIEEICLGLEENPHDQDAIARVFGMVHTIKGSSGFFDPRDLHNYSHAFEDLLKDVQGGKCAVTTEVVSVFLKGNDVLKVLINEFKSGIHGQHDIPEMVKIFKNISENKAQVSSQVTDGSPGQEVSHSTKEQKVSEIRVSMTLLDEFMQTSGEMTVIRNMINKTVRSLEKQYQGDKEIGLLGELLDEMHKINSDVQGKITDIRRVPVSFLVKPLVRTVRDTARALSKEVDFIIEGDDLRLDNSIAEVLSKSLVHMMRNSIDHGIETPQKRVELGKKSKGKLLLRFSLQGENIMVEIQDDGAGINIERIREKVIEKGLRSSAEAKKLTQTELQYMIFDSGFSTAQQVTDFSGRGVGMSMVKDSVESLKGKIHIQSKEGQGSHFKLEIPIPKSVMITNCLFITVADRSYGFPQDHIVKVMEKDQLEASDYTALEGSEIIRFDGKLVPLYSVSKLMGVNNREHFEKLIIIAKTESSFFALRVESVLDIEDAVIKPLSFNTLKALDIYLGGTFLADGSVGLVFNAEGVSRKMGINTKVMSKSNEVIERASEDHELEQRSVIVFDLQKPGHFCLEEKDILRIERLDRGILQSSGGSYIVPYRGTSMTLVDIDQLINPKLQQSIIDTTGVDGKISTIIIQYHKQYVGIVVKEIVDLKIAVGALEANMKKQSGIKGCFIIDEQVVSLVNLEDVLGNDARSEDQLPMSRDQAA